MAGIFSLLPSNAIHGQGLRGQTSLVADDGSDKLLQLRGYKNMLLQIINISLKERLFRPLSVIASDVYNFRHLLKFQWSATTGISVVTP